MPRANAQPVRISAELLQEVAKLAEQTGRTVPREIEHRLRQSLKLSAVLPDNLDRLCAALHL